MGDSLELDVVESVIVTVGGPIPVNIGVRIRKEVGDTIRCVPDVAHRRAAGSRPLGWRKQKPPVPTTTRAKSTFFQRANWSKGLPAVIFPL